MFFSAENEAVYNLLGIKKKKKVRKVIRGFKYIYKEFLLIKVIYSSKDAEYKYLITFFLHKWLATKTFTLSNYGQ